MHTRCVSTGDGPLPRAVLFDLLTALLDSWTLWDSVAGSRERGRAWRARYLQLTYGRGDYAPYERLVAGAAADTGLPASAPAQLVARWSELAPWGEVGDALGRLAGRTRLGVVTNCSRRLGREAAARVPGIAWDCVVTAEDAGAYKPDPRPYRMALAELGVTAADAVFVAGSAYDLIGTAAVGLRTYWHNRVGLARPPGAPAAAFESPTLDALPAWLGGLARNSMT
jgi:2-haloalkanoic acid dehalogenase type II